MRCDNKPVIVYDQDLLLQETRDSKNFSNKWNGISLLLDINHPTRDYIAKVIAKCNNMVPSLATESNNFEWDNLYDIKVRCRVTVIYNVRSFVNECQY